jgi:hypothetical protein
MRRTGPPKGIPPSRGNVLIIAMVLVAFFFTAPAIDLTVHWYVEKSEDDGEKVFVGFTEEEIEKIALACAKCMSELTSDLCTYCSRPLNILLMLLKRRNSESARLRPSIEEYATGRQGTHRHALLDIIEALPAACAMEFVAQISL